MVMTTGACTAVRLLSHYARPILETHCADERHEYDGSHEVNSLPNDECGTGIVNVIERWSQAVTVSDSATAAITRKVERPIRNGFFSDFSRGPSALIASHPSGRRPRSFIKQHIGRFTSNSCRPLNAADNVTGADGGKFKPGIGEIRK